MAKLGKALISIVQVKDGEPKPMYFQWSKSETIFAPKDTNLWFKGSSLIFFGGKAIGNIPYQSDWISDWSKVAKAKTDKYRFLWCKLTEDSEPFLFTGYSGLGTGFLLTADRSTYIINKRLGSSMATTVTLTLSEGMYSPDSLVWTLNDSEISPTKVSETESVYTIAIPYTATYSQAVIKVVPYSGGAVIDSVSATLTLTAKDETSYYSFIGKVNELPDTTSSSSYIRGDSCFLTTANGIYTYNGSEWIEYSKSALSDAEKVTILAKAEKTAFEYAEANGLSQDYAYISTLITKYVYARAIGTELLKLTGEGRIIGGSQETDENGFLKALGVYIDSTGIARFTQAMLNDCHIKGGIIEDIEITGELHNDVLWTNTKEEAGTEYSIGSVGSQLYYLGSEAKAKIKSLLAAENTVYNYSGQYAGVSFTKLFKGSAKPSIGYFADNTLSFSSIDQVKDLEWVCGASCAIRFYNFTSNSTYEITYDFKTFQTMSFPFTQTSFAEANYCYGKFHIFLHKLNKYYTSDDGVSWTEHTHSFNITSAYFWVTVIKPSATEEKLYLFVVDTDNKMWYMYYINSSFSASLVLSTSRASVSYYGSGIDYLSRSSGGTEGTFRQMIMSGKLVGVAHPYIHYYNTSGVLTYSTPSFPTNWVQGTLRYFCGYFVCLVKNSSGTVTLYYGDASYYKNGNNALTWNSGYTFPTVSANNYTRIASASAGNLLVEISDGSLSHLYMSASDDFSVFKEVGSYASSSAEPSHRTINSARIFLYKAGYNASQRKIDISPRVWYKGLNFLNSDLEPLADESALDDYMQSQTLTLNDGTTSLLNLPTTIPSDMNTYRRIPTLFDETTIFRFLDSVTVAEYTIFDSSINAERVISAVSSAIKVSISPNSFKVDDVEKANSTWYIKNATSIVCKFTPLAVAAGVETGSMNPKSGKSNVTIGAITPYKAIRAEQIQADKFEGVYPIGSVYISSSSTDPTTYFGGTWTLVTSSLSLGGITLYMFKRTG